MHIFHKFSKWAEPKPEQYLKRDTENFFTVFVHTYEQLFQTRICEKCNKIEKRKVGSPKIVKTKTFSSR